MRGKEGSTFVTIAIAVFLVFALLAPVCHSGSEGEEITGTPAGWSDDIPLCDYALTNQWCSIASYNEDIHVIWVQDVVDVLYRKSNDGGRIWSPTLTLNHSNSLAMYPDIDVSAQNIHTVWEDREGWDTIYYRNSTDGGDTWNPVRRISSSGTNANARGAKIFVNYSNLHIIWNDWRDGADGEAYYRRSLDGGITFDDGQGVDQDRRISISPSVVTAPRIAGFEGNISVVWMDERNGDFEIYWMISKDNGNTWEDGLGNVGLDRRLTFTGVLDYSISVNGSNIHIVWSNEEWPGPEYRLYYLNSTDNGATWNTPQLLTGPTPLVNSPDIDVEGNQIHIVWDDERDDGTHGEIYYKNSTDNGISWSSDLRLSYNLSRWSYWPRISVENDTKHIVWWDQITGVNHQVMYKRSPDFTPQYVPHLPIRINSNADFDEAHGVVNWATGNGTIWNPWIIEGWDINGTGYRYCIYVGNTTDYFVVRNCYLHHASGVVSYPYYLNSGLLLYNAQNATITDNNASSNDMCGIYLYTSSNNTITNNTASSNDHTGIYNYRSSNITIANNTALWNFIYGIVVYGGNYTISNNTMVGDGITISGNQLWSWNTHTIDITNTVNGKPLHYWKNQTGGTVPVGAGQVILANCTGVTVENQDVSDGSQGIQVGFSNENTIVNNTASSNNMNGIQLIISNNNTIANNTASSNYFYGIHVWGSDNNTIANNTASSNRAGISLPQSNSNIIFNNTASSNNKNGISLIMSDSNTIVNNTLSSNDDYGIRLRQNSDSNTLANNTANSNTNHGISLDSSSDNILTNNLALNNNLGIYLESSSDNILTNNNASSNNWAGIYLSSSSNYNDLTNNTASSNNNYGFFLWDSSCNNTLTDNTANSNDNEGIHIRSSSYNTLTSNTASSNNNEGICLFATSKYNNLINNYVSDNQYGFRILSSSNYNTLTSNTAYSNNNWGVYLMSSSNNLIYHNNFIGNTNQANDSTGTNFWDNGYPSAGNYWCDYTGIDLNSTPTQDVPPPDGIGDSPYTSATGQGIWGGSGAQDNYPLMTPIGGTQYNISLQQGWNLISMPLIQPNEYINVVLTSITGKWDCVQYYDATDSSWKSHNIYRPDSLNDLQSLNHRMGFWINITAPNVNLTVRGYIPSSTSIPLYAGWNLVGYPSLNTETVANALWGTGADKVEKFDAIAPYRISEVGPSYVMKPGEGYWIHVPADSVWLVDW